MTVVKWTVSDGTTTHTFEINPDPNGADGEVPFEQTVLHGYIDANSGLPVETVSQPPLPKASIDIPTLDQTEYDALWSWWNTGKILTVTDDLGRSFTVYLAEFDAKRVRKTFTPWFHNLTISYYVLSFTDL